MPFPVVATWLGFGHETTRGTAVAPTFWAPVRSPDANPMFKYLEDVGWRGSAGEPYGMLPGVRWGEYGYESDAFCDAIGWALSGLLGDVVTTGSADPYSTVFSLLNTGDQQPPSYTLSDYNGFNMRQYPGCQCSEIGLKFQADQFLTYHAKWVGYGTSVATTATRTFTAVVPQVGWNCVTTIAGTASPKLWAADITLARGVKPIHTARGSQDPYRVWSDKLTVKGKLTFVYEDDTELNYYINNTQPSVDLAFAVQGVANRTITLHMSKCGFRDPTKPVRGKEYVETEAEFSAIMNTSDVGASGGYSPIKVTTVSPQAAY